MDEPSQQQVMMPPPSGSTNIYPDSKGDLLEKIQPEKAVEVIKQTLMGKTWNEETGKWEENIALKNNALTESGAMMVAGLIYPACSQNAALSDLKEEKITKRICNIKETLLRELLDNHLDWGIKSQAQIYYIADIAHTIIWVSLTQSEREGIRRLLNSTISESRNVNTYGEERGLFGGIFRRK